MKEYDAILIGTGQATGVLLPALMELGRVAVVEKDKVGGTCVNWGCTPTKTLVASARVAHMVGRSGDFGVNTGAAGGVVDFSRVMERQNSIRNSNTEGFEKYLRNTVDFYRATACFKSDHEVQVGSETIRGKRIYIHTGARARVPDIKGIDSVPYLDNKGILDLQELPAHLMVVGGSYIGLEFSQIFRRLGSKVTVFERGPRIMSREDEDVSQEAERILGKEGITIECNSQPIEVQKAADGVKMWIVQDGERRSCEGSHLLLATGRVPNVEELDLPAAGVAQNERGFIKTDAKLQTNVPHIYAVGDVNGRGAFTHTSVHDGQVIAGNLKGEQWSAEDRFMIYSMFIDPPLGRVGLSEQQAKQEPGRYLLGTMPMKSINRAIEKDETDGLVKVIVEADSGKIAGATVFGVGGDEVINMCAAWMYTGRPYTELQKAVFVHPTVSELMPWVFSNLQKI
jgi:pyruvate/2-oxoglutarate dehydrogenase complex dihydrolipoamide dehydrogenase (E3) component